MSEPREPEDSGHASDDPAPGNHAPEDRESWLELFPFFFIAVVIVATIVTVLVGGDP
jgi:hypothetical protein